MYVAIIEVKRMKILTFIYFLIFCSTQVNAWRGFDWDKGCFIEIEKGNLVREGETIDFFDFDEGYCTMDIDSIDQHGHHVEISGTDSKTGENRIFIMD